MRRRTVTPQWLDQVVYMAVASTHDGGGWLREIDAENITVTDTRHVNDLAAAIIGIETNQAPRWVLAGTNDTYPKLLTAGARLGQSHDVSLTEAILISLAALAGQPHDMHAAHARMRGLPIRQPDRSHEPTQATLFDDGADNFDARAELDVLTEVFTDQRWRLRQAEPAVRLLAAAESAGGLIAAEMTHHGLPWRIDTHDAILTELVGPRPVRGLRPKKMQLLSDDINVAFGHRINPDSPQQVLAAFKKAGHAIESTRAWELKTIDHAAVTPLLRYKELARIHSGHGWTWLSDWVGDGPGGRQSPAKRFRPHYVVGGVVTGRWATDGGAALQIPKVIRAASRADHGHKLVVADAAQLEPRMLAAMSGDPAMTAAAEATDMYAALAPTFSGSREDAKIALLSAMYGGTAGNATTLLSVMRHRFPQAYAYVEDAARTGEKGDLVRTWLGRTCPPPDEAWWSALTGPQGSRRARERGRFTRNFIVQGTAAEWALSMMALLRSRLHTRGLGQLVFFQHDEIIVDCMQHDAEEVAAAIQETADQATALLFGRSEVRVPLTAVIVDSYDQAK